MLDTTVAISTTRDALSRLIDGYKDHVTKNNMHGNVVIDEYEDSIYHQLLEHSRELDWLLQQTDGLRQKLLGTSHLVRAAFLHLFRAPLIHIT
jgi:hypothetical protein